MVLFIRCAYIYLWIPSLWILTYRVKSTKGTITVPLIEEQPRNTPIVDLREILDVPMKENPHIEFKILEQYLTLVRSTPVRSSAAESVWLKVDLSSGILRQNDRVDREELCGNVQVCYIVTKVVLLPQDVFRFETLHLPIKDINDNAPLFPSRLVDISVSETSEIGDEINLDKEQASDKDFGSNSTIRYSVLPSNEFFQVRQFRDENQNPHLRLVVNKILDYELDRVHRITLRAIDGGEPALSNNMDLTINIIDQNDNSPVFEHESYEITVRESLPPGQDIALVKAMDRDSGRRGNVHYLIRDSTGNKYPVVINNVTGAVKLREKLNHKLHDGLQVLIEAVDGDIERPNVGKTVLLLHVEDVNDHAPLINVNYIVPNHHNTAFVAESEPIGTFLAHVTATDADEGNNGEVSLNVETVVPGTQDIGNVTEEGFFSINQDNLLETGIKLNREKRNLYDIIISATDHGNPSQSTTHFVRIVILDVNEYRPLFQHDDFNLILPESTKVGSQIAVAKAKDGDADNLPAWRLTDLEEIEPSLNGEITYGINVEIDDDTADVLPVSIDSKSGKITLIRLLDYETKKLWNVIITARDGGHPVALQDTCRMVISVGNVNDNRPTFVKPNVDNSTVFASTIGPNKVFITIEAYDFGVDENSELQYSFRILSKDGNHFDQHKYNSLFHLDRITGEFSITRDSYSDEEILGTYKATIFALDSGMPPLQSSMTLYIRVINTIPPAQSVYYPPHGDGPPPQRGTSMGIIIGAGIGGFLVLIVIIIAAVFCCCKRKQRNTKENVDSKLEKALQTLTETPSHYVEPTLKVRTRSGSSAVNSLRRNGKNCDHVFNTSSTQHTTLSTTVDGSCQLCDAPTSPKGMQKFIEKQQSDVVKAPLHAHGSSWSHQPVATLDLSPVCSDEQLTRDDNECMGGQCTDMCKLYGHSDSCWMPITEHTVMLQHSSNVLPRSPWQQKFETSRKDSGCSVDTTSSALSYYKLTKTENNRHNEVFIANEPSLPDVVGKSRVNTHSDGSSMMSSNASSGASTSRYHNNSLSKSSLPKSPNYRSLRKSNNNGSVHEEAMTSKRTRPLPSMSTEC